MDAAAFGNQPDDVVGQSQQPVEAFSPDSQKMPDWKKELLLKRKSKVQTTTSSIGDGKSNCDCTHHLYE